MRRFCRVGILLIAGWCGCTAAGEQRVDVTTPRAHIALHQRDADAGESTPAAGSQADQRRAVVRVFYGTDRAQRTDPPDADEFYSGQCGQLELGMCDVSIPDEDQSQQEMPPRIWRFEFREETGQHAMLLGIEPVDRSRFTGALKSDVNVSETGAAFVFVHGGEVGFAEAARQTARIAHNLRFDGPPILYSWPSPGERPDRLIDQTAVLQSQSHLARFLQTVSQDSGASRVHLIAQGAGTQLVAGVLCGMSESSFPHDQTPFQEVILADPDIDADTFTQEDSARMMRVADRVTIYVSDDDPDVPRPTQLHGSGRQGERRLEPASFPDVPGIDVVDVTARDLRILGSGGSDHGHELLGDIRQVINGAATTQRGLQPHPSHRPAWRLPSSELQFVSHSEVDTTEEEKIDEEVTESAARNGLWSKLTNWWPW